MQRGSGTSELETHKPQAEDFPSTRLPSWREPFTEDILPSGRVKGLPSLAHPIAELCGNSHSTWFVCLVLPHWEVNQFRHRCRRGTEMSCVLGQGQSASGRDQTLGQSGHQVQEQGGVCIDTRELFVEFSECS